MLVQIDVDNTLYFSDNVFAEVASEAGVAWPEEYRHWFGPEEIGTDLQTLKTIFRKAHSREYVSKQVPFPHASDVISRLVRDYSEIRLAYVSDRNEQQTGALRDWLEEWGFLPNEDTFVAATADKRDWMREEKPSIVIDDRVRTQTFGREEIGAYVLGLEYPHNINLRGGEWPGIFICSNWQEIGKHLDRMLSSGVKRCRACNKIHVNIDFHKSGDSRTNVCKFCVAASTTMQQRRDRRLNAIYGMTLQDYDELLARQDGGCAICGREEDPLSVDHDHLTGEVRGLLCRTCNLGLQNFQDSPISLRAASNYLESGPRYQFEKQDRRGLNRARASLSDQTAREIKQRLLELNNQRGSDTIVAREFGIKSDVVSNIRRGKTYRHVVIPEYRKQTLSRTKELV